MERVPSGGSPGQAEKTWRQVAKRAHSEIRAEVWLTVDSWSGTNDGVIGGRLSTYDRIVHMRVSRIRCVGAVGYPFLLKTNCPTSCIEFIIVAIGGINPSPTRSRGDGFSYVGPNSWKCESIWELQVPFVHG